MSHAKLSPSASSRWSKCTKAPGREQKHPDQTSIYAEEGTEAHNLLERSVKAKTRPSELEPDHPAAKDVDVAYDYLAQWLHDPRWTVLTETRVDVTEDCWGTADIIAYSGDAIKVIDYKHGRGVLVEVPSIQLNIYSEAAIKSLSWLFTEPVETIATTIIQPRAPHEKGPIRTKVMSREELDAAMKPVYAAIETIRSGDTSYAPSEETCRWCKAKADCKAFADMALEGAKAFFTDTGRVESVDPTTVETLSLDEKVAIHEASKSLSILLAAVEESLKGMMMTGTEVPGYKVVAGRSIRKWGAPEKDIIATLIKKCKLKKADIMPPKLLGPAKIEKLIDPKARNGKKKLEELQAVITKPEGKPAIVIDSDPRASIAPFFKTVEPKTDNLLY